VGTRTNYVVRGARHPELPQLKVNPNEWPAEAGKFVYADITISRGQRPVGSGLSLKFSSSTHSHV